MLIRWDYLLRERGRAIQTDAQGPAAARPGAGPRALTIEGAMAHAHIKSRITLMKYIEHLNIELKRPGIGSKRLYISWEDAERVRLLREDPLRLEELKHPPRVVKGPGHDA
jgi:hypothetical protein